MAQTNPKRGIINRKKVTTKQLNREPMRPVWDGVPLGEASPTFNPVPPDDPASGPPRRNGPRTAGPPNRLSEWSSADWTKLNKQLKKKAKKK